MTVKKAANPTITIPALKLETIVLKIVGDSPLISHAWSEKAKLMMLQKQQKKATQAKEIRRPSAEFADSLYWLTEKPNFDGLTDAEVQEILIEVIPKSKFGFPTLAFKTAALEGAFQQGILAQKAGTAKLAKTTAKNHSRLCQCYRPTEARKGRICFARRCNGKQRLQSAGFEKCAV